MPRRSPICLFDRPSTIKCNISSSREVRSRLPFLFTGAAGSCGSKTSSPATTRSFAAPKSKSLAFLRMNPRAPIWIALRTHMYSECILRKSTAVSGQVSMIFWVATRPHSRHGISMTTTRGLSFWTNRTASSPSPDSPTLGPIASSSRRRNPRRTLRDHRPARP
jgi:hypothetical protein